MNVEINKQIEKILNLKHKIKRLKEELQDECTKFKYLAIQEESSIFLDVNFSKIETQYLRK